MTVSLFISHSTGIEITKKVNSFKLAYIGIEVVKELRIYEDDMEIHFISHKPKLDCQSPI